jgi:methionyl-tRNA formyltransferase
MSSTRQGLRIIFAGTPEFAAHHLKALIDSHHCIVAVYTQPDRPSGRGKKLTPSPVKALAIENELPVFQPQSLKSETDQEQLAALNADLMVVVAYGLLLPENVLNIPHYGCINVHGSLLPRWRGAAPIQRAIDAGDQSTGITIMQMDAGLDTGDMLYKVECDIDVDETSQTLHDKLMVLGATALLKTLDLLEGNKLEPVKQNDDLATYAEKISKEEAEIDWTQSAEIIARKLRAYNPFPIAYTFIDDSRIKIYQASITNLPQKNLPGNILALNNEGLLIACGKNALLVQKLQLPGKKPMGITDIINGYSDNFKEGKSFGR